ncbi:hypothetical protein SAMN04487926_13569 [Paraburkholderia steynii]|uniref:Uncharacterized protein n=1 Tax=Paraburkholderia steynii TaxID=1245441 RepID=A0A7Z7BG56_9BURK|nr:hypothetical protein [Paraburkholderia steynii]SDJ15961.1 hypothetical protein SAMN04487926_13569 [Paraburkholderia steynii]
MDAMQQARREAASAANAEDASVWRWFAYLLEDRRIRWRWQFNSWLVHVDRTHVATESTFDRAIREAKAATEMQDLGVVSNIRLKKPG